MRSLLIPEYHSMTIAKANARLGKVVYENGFVMRFLNVEELISGEEIVWKILRSDEEMILLRIAPEKNILPRLGTKQPLKDCPAVICF